MNYPQEKYNEVKIATGCCNMSNLFIDRILSIFATVPQVTLEEASHILSDYHERYSTGEKDLRDAVNAVLAKQGPVIAATPADGMVSLEDVDNAIRDNYLAHRMPTNKSFRDEVRARLTKNKKPEPTVTLVDAAEGRTLEVPASAVHEMEYPEAVTYTRDPWTGKDMCNLCGVYVVDKVTHAAFHGRMEGK